MPKIIPFGNRILVRRRKIGEKAGSIVLPQEVQEKVTDLADVVYVSELTFGDNIILDNAKQIINATIEQAKSGNSYAINTLLEFNNYLKQKSIKTGDVVMISKYVGTDFHETGSAETLTLVNSEDIIGIVIDD